MLEDLSQQGRDAELSFLLEAKQAAGYFHTDRLNEEQRTDWKLLSDAINARLLELQEIRMWQKNPDIYSSSATRQHLRADEPQVRASGGAAEVGDRARAEDSRQSRGCQGQPEESAARSTPKSRSSRCRASSASSRRTYPRRSRTSPIRNCWRSSRRRMTRSSPSLQRYQDFLKNDLLPISKGDFRIGPELYRKKLLYDEMVDIPLDRLLQIGYDDLHKNQAELKRVAALIDPGKTPEQVLAELEQDHPKPDQLLQSFRDTFNSLIGFIQQKQIITIPSDIRPIVRGDAAVRARPDLRFDGHARALRDQGHGGVLQRHAA